MKNILITGADGFLGSSFQAQLHQYSSIYKVFGLVRRKSRQKNIFSCPFENSKRLQSILHKIRPQIIFHFAGGRSADPEVMLQSNVMTTFSLLEAVKSMQGLKPRVIIPSSAAEYGNIKGTKLISENTSPGSLAWYGFVKKMQTELALNYVRSGLDVVIVRLFNISGYNASTKLAIGNFVQQIVRIERTKKENVIQTMNLDGKRDFLDIEDVYRAIMLVAQRGIKGEIYNICSSKGTTVRDLLRKLIAYSTAKNIRIEENRKITVASFNVIGSNKKLKSLGSWSPRVSLDESLQRTLLGYRTKSS